MLRAMHGVVPESVGERGIIEQINVVRPRTIFSEMIETVVVYANVAAYAACYMAQTPVLPYLIHHIGAEASAYGILQTILSAFQTVGGLVSGVLMDRYGAKVVLLASLIASAATYGLTACAKDMPLLYASSVPTLFQHAVLAVRVWVSNASRAENRAAMLGYIGLAYSIGQIAGPAIGGQVGHVAGPRGPAYLAMWGSILSSTTVLLFLKGRRASDADDEHAENGKPKPKPSLSDVIAVCGVPGVPSLLGTKFLAGLSVHGLLIKWLDKRFSDAKIVMVSCWILLFSFFVLVLQHSFLAYLALLVPITAASYVFSIVNTAQLTKAVSPEQLGSILAVDMALGSATRMVSPLIGTLLLQMHGVAGIGISSSSAVALAVIFMQFGFANAAVDGVRKHS